MKTSIWAIASVLVLGATALCAQPLELVGITNSLWRYSIDNSDQYALGFPNVDDSTWPEDRAVFGNDFGYPYPNVVIVPGPANGVQTSYYRTRFNWTGSTTGVVLIMTNYIDDGLFVYLNGTPILNWNVNGTPTHATPAAAPNPGGEPVRVVHQVALNTLTNGNVNPLLPGQNVLSVSVHQTPASSDSVFAMSVYVSPITVPCVPGVVPASTNVNQCRSVTLALNLPDNCGVTEPTIQWFHNGVPIPSATRATLTLANVQPGVHSGVYHAELSNPAGTTHSAQATVGVVPDTQGPRIVVVSGVTDFPNRWLVTFDEPVLSGGGADDTGTYEISSSGTTPRYFTVLSAEILSSLNEVVLITAEGRDADERHVYSTLHDIADVCAGNKTSAGLNGPIWAQATIVTYGDATLWRYNDSGTDQGIAWREPFFDDSVWKTGRQVFDRTRSNLARTEVAGLNVGTFLELTNYAVAPPTNLTSVYFRLKRFVPSWTERLVAFPIYDDGFIFYVNGTEVYRTNVAAGADQFLNYGGGSPAIAGHPNFVAPFEIPLSAIIRGAENTFAVMLKQNDSTSPDLTFGLRIIPTVHVDEEVLCRFIQQPAPVSVSEGHAFTLMALVAGISPEYQWFKDGVPIEGATSATYTKVSAGISDAGNYRLDVSNAAGTVSSDTVSVTVRPVLVPYGFHWKFATNSQDATLGATPWYATAFDDSAWPSGPGPFGHEALPAQAGFPCPIATPLPPPSTNFLTAYFRTTVTVPNLSPGAILVLTHLVDDGAIFYLDGVRTLNYNGPTTDPALSTDLAPGATPGLGDAMKVSVPLSLSPGSHTIAVEVHQNATGSSDVVFGAELRLLTNAAPPLTITHPTPASVSVAWTPDPLFSLYQSAAITGPFLPVGGDPQGAYTVTAIVPDAARYFQLRYNGR